MATINENLEKLSESDILNISERYLMGWHELERVYGFRVKGLNRKRLKLGLEPLDKNKSLEYRVNYIKQHYTSQEIYDTIASCVRSSRLSSERWIGIELFGCRFGRDYVRAFRLLIGSSCYRRLSEECRVEKLIETQLTEYGGVGLGGTETMKKAVKTNQQKYGTDNPMQNESVKCHLAAVNTNKFGGISPFSSSDIRQKAAKQKMSKIYAQMEQFAKDGIIKNVDCFGSIGEMILFINLVERFGRRDVFYQYGIHPTDSRYPFNCDFYIKSLDLFIELNVHYSHHTHWFDKTDPKDVLRRDHMLSSGKKRNVNAVKVWCETDVIKRETAKQNNLRYLVFWDGLSTNVKGQSVPRLKDFYMWFNDYNCDIDLFLKDYPNNTY